ncbi:hypothetical protein GCM10007103_35190 [Salinimicrobium marinum]|uniref:Lipocalin-like domain-containing protein n=2 Tax=Salinimicrobium marinum TaxID=680283 RepID=A0A918W329_9FLAO|nr:hypothetical protein GCM10007103_35190 [Salinimicrobium marinum]
MSSCSKNEEISERKDLTFDHSITGNWKLVEAYISSGGPQYWVDIENGEEFTFLSNGSFESNKFSECTTGDFLVESKELFLNYNCDGFTSGFETPEGAITYRFTFEDNYLILTPTSVVCVEGCSYKYKRI